MVVTEYGKSGNALMWVGSANQPQFSAIGSGSGADVSTIGSLIAETQAARLLWSSRDISTPAEVAYEWNYSSTTMSGTFLREFGIGGSILKGVNDLWIREAFDPVTFDGTNELQLQVNLKTL